jgi:hypothetical protein
MSPPGPGEVRRYFDAVFRRQGQAAEPRRLQVRYEDGTEPQPACCHENAERWVCEHPDYEVVRGWAIAASSGGGSLMLAAHTVVRAPGGELVEITPLPSYSVRFIAHQGEEGVFAQLRAQRASVWWPPPK